MVLPEIPDDDADFTPDLARKIIAKYQALLGAAQASRDALIEQCAQIAMKHGDRLEIHSQRIADAIRSLNGTAVSSTECKHLRRTGGGSVGTDGSWSQYWHCSHCGESGSDSGPSALSSTNHSGEA